MSNLSTCTSKRKSINLPFSVYSLRPPTLKCFMNAPVGLKFELHSTLTFTEAVQKFSQMLFTHVKPVEINVYCLLANEFNLNLGLYYACSTKPTVLDCTYSVLSLKRIKKGANNETKAKNKTIKRHSCVIFLSFSQIFRDGI